MTSPSRDLPASIAMSVFLALVLFVSLYAYRAPAPLPEDAPPEEFSARRAIKHIEAFAQVPHRAGTDANRKVRDYIVGTLKGMGAEPVVSETTVARGGTMGSPQNVLARLPGTANTKAFMLVTHYDSVPWGPGACDDGAGVAALLDTYRALEAGPRLMNDVIFLFTDGEECGLLGAKAFLDHPWADDVGLMLNFEARGVSGPSYMFETSAENGWLVPHLLKAAPYPRASSIMFDLYIKMPTTTDYRVLKEKLPGAGLAFIEYLPYYHSCNDKPENVNLASLQHHGSYALGFARYFGDTPLDDVKKAPDAVYFNAIGSIMIHYPGSWATPITVLVVLVLAGVLALGLFKERLTWPGIAKGFGAFLVSAICVSAVLAAAIFIAYQIRGMYMLYNGTLYALASVGLTLCVFLALYNWLRNRASVDDLAFGALMWWGAVAVAITFLSQGGACLFQWPLLFSAVGLAVTFLLPESNPVSPLRLTVLGLSAVPGLLLVVPASATLFSAVTVVPAPVSMLAGVLLLGLLIPHLAVVAMPNRLLPPALCGVAGLVLYVAAILLGGFTEAHPKMNAVCYGLNADSAEAFWMSSDKKPDEWTSQFFPPDVERRSISEFHYPREYLKTPAPVAQLPPPEVEVLSDAVEGDVRTLDLHIDSPRRAPRVRIYSDSEAETHALMVNGEPTDRKGKKWSLNYNIFPGGGIDLKLETAPDKPLKLTLVDHTYDLPEIPGMAIKPRPAYMIPQPNTVNFAKGMQSQQTMVVKSFTF